MSLYKFKLEDNASAVLGELPARNRSFATYLNAAGAASCETKLLYEDAGVQALIDAIVPFATYVRIERDGVAKFHGEIQQPVETLSADSKSFVIPILGHLDQFSDRYTLDSVTYSQIDQGDIAWALINDTQSRLGTFGITKGNTTTGVLRDRTYEAKRIDDAVKELAACEDGFDFEITPSKVFNVFYPQKGVRRKRPRIRVRQEYRKGRANISQAKEPYPCDWCRRRREHAEGRRGRRSQLFFIHRARRDIKPERRIPV